MAVISCFDKRLCSSTTVMANMPAFTEACRLARQNKLEDHIGIHLNLTSGTPLSTDIRGCQRFCNEDGTFRSRRRRLMWLNEREKAALTNEMHHQVGRCRKHGLNLTHADSHHHIHEEWSILSLVLCVCREKSIPYVRLARNCSSCDVPLMNRLYRHAINQRIRSAHLAGTRYFGSLSDYIHLSSKVGTRKAKVKAESMGYVSRFTPDVSRCPVP